MASSLEVLFTPAEFDALKNRNLSDTVCIVFDVLRATTAMLTALQNGADKIFCVKEISDALNLRRQMPQALLAGERNGVRILASQTGGVVFDLGNSPREFTPARVRGKTIIMTTTNGTRALFACDGASEVLVGALLNLGALANWVSLHRPSHVILVGAGTFEQAAFEDTLAVGALCAQIWDQFHDRADSAEIARELYLQHHLNLPEAFARHSRNARRLLTMPDLRDDVPFALARDTIPMVARVRDGAVVRDGDLTNSRE